MTLPPLIRDARRVHRGITAADDDDVLALGFGQGRFDWISC
jgi:hypothetical protein